MHNDEVAARALRALDRDETLETSRLLVEFLHASYATRRMDTGDDEPRPLPAAGDGDGGGGGTGESWLAGPSEAATGVRATDAAEAGHEPFAPQGSGLPGAHGPSAHAIRAAIHIYQHGDRTVSQLAAGLGISLGWASRVADELVDRGHAVRERDPNDRRVVRLTMTQAALAEIERAYRWRGDAVAQALAAHSPSERAAIRAFLRRVTDELSLAAARRRVPASGPRPGSRPPAGQDAPVERR